MVSGRLFISNPVLPVPNTRLYLIFCPSIRLACYSFQIINPLTQVFINLIDLIINSFMLYDAIYRIFNIDNGVYFSNLCIHAFI